MRKLLTIATVGLVLLAACGKENKAEQGALTTTKSSAPEVKGKAKSKAAKAMTKGGGGTTTSASAQPGGGTEASSAPVQRAPAGGENRPKDGSYVYTLKGKASNPFNPAGPPQEFSGTQTHKISHSGDVYTTEATSSERPGKTTLKTKWSSDRILLLSQKTETPNGNFECTYNPPPVIAKFPTKPETFPTQHLKGSGNACDGTLDITVVKKETVKDANGRDWSTWHVNVKLTIKSGQYTIKSDDTRWVSPDLGVEIRMTGHQDVTFGTQHFTSDGTTALKSHP